MTTLTKFKRVYEKRIMMTVLDVQKCYILYQEEGEEAFLDMLEEHEEFEEFSKEYYDYMRERWNACGSSMWYSFREWRDNYDRNVERYWDHLKSL